jgi:hypothetical protein
VDQIQYRPSSTTALILSPDPLAGALVAAAVEVAGIRPVFARDGESPRESLRRLRPMFLLLDCDDPAIHDEALLGPAMMAGARLFLFGTEQRTTALHQLVAHYQFGVIVFPRDAESLREILTGESESTRRRRESTVR